MAPYNGVLATRSTQSEEIMKPSEPDALILEAWAQGYMIGSLVIMAAITVANMRRGVILHKLILIELIFGMFHGTFIFPKAPVYGWYLSTTAIFLNTSWSLHNVISWMKTKPFLTKKWSYFYIGTVILVQPYWVVEIYANFAYFNNINTLFHHTRPYEALCRDPWWIFTIINLFYNISTRYDMNFLTVIRISPRFGVLLASMCLSIAFLVVDICSVTGAFASALPEGLNPFWKLSFVFKCLCDSIILDDFKTALDRLMRHKLQREAVGSNAEFAFGTNGSDGFALAPLRTHSHSADPLGDDSIDRDKVEEKRRESANLDKGMSKSTMMGTGATKAEIALNSYSRKGFLPRVAHQEDVEQPRVHSESSDSDIYGR